MSVNHDECIMLGLVAHRLGLADAAGLREAIERWARCGDEPLDPASVEAEQSRRFIGDLLTLHISGNDDQVRHALNELETDPLLSRILSHRNLGEKGTADAEVPPTRAHSEPVAATRDTQVADSSSHGPPSWASSSSVDRFVPVRIYNDQGGMGRILLARDRELDREVALKEIKSKFEDSAELTARFRREAEITGRLEHPGVIPVYGLGLHNDGRPFYAMRLIRGESLGEAVLAAHKASPETDAAGQRIVFQRLLRRFLDVCNTLAYAHTRGVVHRDLKPANIMLGPYGETLVVDWGLARLMSTTDAAKDTPVPGGEWLKDGSSVDLTAAGAVFGTPGYMSPEQATGETESIGPRSDIYSLGATLYYILTGRRPFESRSTPKILMQTVEGDFPPPHKIRDTVPAPLEAICLKAMALRPKNRYATAQDLAKDIECWLADEPISAWREPLLSRLGRWARRHQALSTTLLAAIVVIILMLAIVPILWAEWDRQQRADLVVEPPTFRVIPR